MGGRHPYRACPKILHPHISCKIFTLLSFALSTGEHWGKGQKAVHRIKQGHTLLLNHSAKPCVKGLKITIKVKKKVTIAAVELHRSLLMTKRIASISPRAGWDPHPPPGQWCRYPAIPRDPLPVSRWQHRAVPAGDVAVATGCDFSACNAVTVSGHALRRIHDVWGRQAGGTGPVATPGSLACYRDMSPASAASSPPSHPFSSPVHNKFSPKMTLEISQPKAGCYPHVLERAGGR